MVCAPKDDFLKLRNAQKVSENSIEFYTFLGNPCFVKL